MLQVGFSVGINHYSIILDENNCSDGKVLEFSSLTDIGFDDLVTITWDRDNEKDLYCSLALKPSTMMTIEQFVLVRGYKLGTRP